MGHSFTTHATDDSDVSDRVFGESDGGRAPSCAYLAFKDELAKRFEDQPRPNIYVQAALFFVARGWFWTTGDTICGTLVCSGDDLFCLHPTDDHSDAAAEIVEQICAAIVAEFDTRGLLGGQGDRVIQFVQENTALGQIADKSQPISVRSPEMTPFERTWAYKVDDLYHEFLTAQRTNLPKVDGRFWDSDDDEIFSDPNWICLNGDKKPEVS